MSVLRQKSAIGLDIRNECVHAAQLVQSGQATALHRLASVPCEIVGDHDRIDDETQRLLATLDRRGFEGDRFVIAAPHESLRSSVVSVPSGVGPDVMQAVARSELARTHQLEPSGFEVACWGLPGVVGASADSGSALACACPHESVVPLVDRFGVLGAEIEAVDLESKALARACGPQLGSGDRDLRVIVDLGWSRATVLVMLGQVTLYERNVHERSLGGLVEQVRGTLGVNGQVAERAVLHRGVDRLAAQRTAKGNRIAALFDEYLDFVADEVVGSIDYAVRKHGLTGECSVLLTGAGAGAPGIDARLGAACGVGVVIVRPKDIASAPDGFEGADDPALVLAIGLASGMNRRRIG